MNIPGRFAVVAGKNRRQFGRRDSPVIEYTGVRTALVLTARIELNSGACGVDISVEYYFMYKGPGSLRFVTLAWYF